MDYRASNVSGTGSFGIVALGVRLAGWVMVALFFLVAVLLVSTPPAAGNQSLRSRQPARLIRAEEELIEFEVVVDTPRFVSKESEAGSFEVIRIRSFFPHGKPGEAELPHRAFLIGIPGGAEYDVVVLPLEEMRFHSKRIVPVAFLSESPDGTAERRIVPSESFYQSNRFFPSSPLLGVRESWMRNQRVIGIDVSPVRYNPSSGSLVVFTKLRVTISLRSSGARSEARGEPLRPDAAAADALEALYQATLLNYDQSRSWRQAPRAVTQAQDSFGSSANWCKVFVNERGIYRVTGLDLLGAGVSGLGSINPLTLRLFNGGGLPVDAEKEPSSLDTWMDECAIYVDDGGDGRFDENDYVLFYGVGTSDWLDHFKADTLAVYHENIYTGENVYWLTWNGSFMGNPEPRRVELKNGIPVTPGAYTPQSFPARIHIEENNEYDPSLFEIGQRWEKWWYQTLSNPGDTGSTSYLYTFGAPNSEPAVRCSVMVRLWAPCTLYDPWCSSIQHSARVLFNRQLVGEESWMGKNVRKDLAGSGFWAQESDSVIITLSSPRDELYLAWYELQYGKRLIVDTNSFAFSSPDTNAVVRFFLTGVSDTAGLRLLDVTDYFSPVEIVQYALNWSVDSFTLEFEDTLQAGGHKHYLLVPDSGVKSPERVVLRQFSRYLRTVGNAADYVVITHESLVPGMDGLRSLRETALAAVADPGVMVVSTAEIYDEFSWGLEDAGALRDFIMYAYWYWTGGARQVSYVVLAGDASYDFRDYYGYGLLNLVSAWEEYYDHEIETQVVSDDFFGLLDGPGDKLLDVCVGRVPIRNLAEASTVIDGKLLPYESSPQPGVWRNRAILVADDNTICTSPDPSGYEHVKQTELVATNNLPEEMDRVKVYLTEFSYDPMSCYKSKAKEAFLSSFSDGALIANYIGHGSWNQLAHEQVFQLRDVASLSNGGKLPLFFAGSCKVAKFDEPSDEGLGEAVMRVGGGGTIASVAATALAFSVDNYEFNAALFDFIFPEGTLDSVTSLGIAVQATKSFQAISMGDTLNSRRYVLLGDPALTLAAPELEVVFDTTGIDTLRLGEVVTVSGEVKDDGTLAEWYDGSVDVLVAGSEIERSPADWVTYYLPGYQLYHGEATVEQGAFEFSFVVPSDTTIAGPRGRLRGYSLGSLEGAGVVYPIVIDSAGVPPVDTTGPFVVLRFDNDARYVPSQSILRVLLRDEHGMNTTGASTSGSILLQVDRALQPVDLTSSFVYLPDSYQEGGIDYALPALPLGPHTVTLVAYDNLGNRGSGELEFEIVEHGTLSLRDVINYPNPFEEETYITFEVTTDAVATIKLFTVSGKLIRELCESSPVRRGNNQFRWDGRDAEGHTVANGVYLYKVEVVDGQGKRDSFIGRAAVLR